MRKKRNKKKKSGKRKVENIPLYRNIATTGFPDALERTSLGTQEQSRKSGCGPGVRAQLEAAALAETNARMETKRLETVQEELWKSSLERIVKGGRHRTELRHRSRRRISF